MAKSCRRCGIAPNLYYRWKGEAQQRVTKALGGKPAMVVEREENRASALLDQAYGERDSGLVTLNGPNTRPSRAG